MCNATLSEQSTLFQSITVAQRSCKLMVLIKQTTRPFCLFSRYPLLSFCSRTLPSCATERFCSFISLAPFHSLRSSFSSLTSALVQQLRKSNRRFDSISENNRKSQYHPSFISFFVFLSTPHFFMLHPNQHALAFRFITFL